MFASFRNRGDRRDERRALALREQLGRRRWLLSWSPLDDRRWIARLSCEEWHETVEEVGRTRFEAIRLAAEALRLDLAHRYERDVDDLA